MRINRRELFAVAAMGAARAAFGAEKQEKRALPLLSGALQQYNHDAAATDGLGAWKKELEEQQRLGFDLLWLGNVHSALHHGAQPDLLHELMDLARERGMSVILDIGATPAWYSKLDVKGEIEVIGKNIQVIKDRYAEHPAFFGWYVPHEIYVAYDAFGEYINALYPALVQLCKAAAPAKPVTVSPFFILDQDKVFGDFRYAPPEEFGAYWSALIRRGGFDVVMLQDSGEHFSYVTNEQREPFFAAMRQACEESGAALWGNVECAEFECPSIEEYVKRYGRVHHTAVPNAPWRAVPMDRMRGKLELAARYCDRLMTWGYQEFGRPATGSGWYEDYAKYRDQVLRAKAPGEVR